MAEKKIIDLRINSNLDKTTKDAAGLKNELNQTSKSADSLGESSKGLMSKLDAMTGGAISGFKSMTSGLFGVSGGFKTVGMAIALSGLGLLVLTIAAITAAFKNTEEGQNKFAKIMGVIGSVTGNLIDLLANLGEKLISVFENPKKSLIAFGNLIKENIVNRFEGMLELFPAIGKAIKLVFEGEFEKAGKVAVDAVAKVGLGVTNVSDKLKGLVKGSKEYFAEVKREAILAAQIADDRAKADILERELINKKADAENRINILREKSIQEDKFSASQRIGFLKEALKISDDIALQEAKVATLRANAKKVENTLSGSTKEDLKEEAELRANVIRIDTERLAGQRRLASTVQSLQKEELANLKALEKDKQKILDDADQLRLLKEKQLNDDFKRIELDLTKGDAAKKIEQDKIELDAKIKQGKDLAEANKLSNDKILADDIITANARVAIQNSVFDNISAGINLLKSVFEKNKALQKGLLIAESAAGIAKIVINTQAANAAAVLKYALIPGGIALAKGESILNNISAGIGIASNIAATAKALSSLGGGGAGSAPSLGGGGGGATQQSTAPQFNVVGANGISQVAQSLAGNRQPIKAFVVGKDVSTQQALDRNIVKFASLG
jgi:hypothetical protein